MIGSFGTVAAGFFREELVQRSPAREQMEMEG